MRTFISITAVSSLSLTPVLLLAAALTVSGCGRVTDPVARLTFQPLSPQSVVTETEECSFDGGLFSAYETANALPSRVYSAVRFSGLVGALDSPMPRFTNNAPNTTLELPVSPKSPQILVGSGYLSQSRPGELNCLARSARGEVYSRILFPVTGAISAHTYTKSEDVEVTMVIGPPLRITTGAPSPAPPQGFRTLKIRDSGSTGNPDFLTYAIVGDLDVGMRTLALPFASASGVPTIAEFSAGCTDLSSSISNCVAASGKPLLPIYDAINSGMITHYLSPLLPGHTYTVRWETYQPASGNKCRKKTQVVIPFGEPEDLIELTSESLSDCSSEAAIGFPGGQLAPQ